MDNQVLQKMLVEHCIDLIPTNSKKKIFYIMKGDGIWQVRKNNIGTFYIHQSKTKIPGLPSDLKEGLELNVPLIPIILFKNALSFFRAVYRKYQSEAHIQFFYNIKTKKYFLYCPSQKVSCGSISYNNDCNFKETENILVLEMHSHGDMSAFFSTIDDSDEKGDRFFGVLGNINQYNPDMKFRLSIGGSKIDINIDDIFDVKSEFLDSFPKEWLLKVKKQKIKEVKQNEFTFSKFIDDEYLVEDKDSEFKKSSL